jgi:hypothetical protein
MHITNLSHDTTDTLTTDKTNFPVPSGYIAYIFSWIPNQLSPATHTEQTYPQSKTKKNRSVVRQLLVTMHGSPLERPSHRDPPHLEEKINTKQTALSRGRD